MEKETMGLFDYFQIIRKRLWLIVLITGFCTGLSAFVSYHLLTPIYQAKTEILVNKTLETNSKEKEPLSITLGEIDSNLKLVETYKDIVLSPRIIENAYNEIGNSIVLSSRTGYFNQNQGSAVEQLTKMLDVEVSEKSQVITILVKHHEPKQATLIANTVAKIFQQEVKSLLNVDNVQILAEARVNTVPVSPIPMLNISIAFVLGLMISILIAFLLKATK